MNLSLDQHNSCDHNSAVHNSADPIIAFLFAMQIRELLSEYVNRGGGHWLASLGDSKCWWVRVRVLSRSIMTDHQGRLYMFPA
jgi:hypothetical protein